MSDKQKQKAEVGNRDRETGMFIMNGWCRVRAQG